MDVSKPPKNPWARSLKIQTSLEECLVKDFDRVVTAYVKGEDKSYATFCQLAQAHGITLSFHWCAPNTTKKPCHTREYSDKVVYLILQTAKSFWLCSSATEECRKHPGNKQEKFLRQIGGLFLVHVLYGSQPSLPGHKVQIDVGVSDAVALEEFIETVKHLLINRENDGPVQKFYEGLMYIYNRLKVEGAFRPTVLPFEVGVNFLNFKN